MNKKIWNKCLSILKKQVSYVTFESWFLNTSLIDINEKQAVIQVPTKFYADWIQEHYQTILIQILEQVSGNRLNLIFTIDNEINKVINNDIEMNKKNNIKNDKNSSIHVSTLNSRYTFENFVVGSCNQFAYESSLQVGKLLTKVNYNPLFIYGSSGLGKTHLVQAIGNKAYSINNNINICYVSSETFTLKFIQSVKENTKENFVNYFRNMDILLIDDIQFFSGKEGTQEEFFHTFNALHNSGKQIVLTSDRAPIEIKDVEDRLITRFQSGLVVDVQAPDFETRVAILQKKADFYRLSLSNDVFVFLANNFKSNIRELEGVITKISAFHSLSGIEINLSAIKEILHDLLPKKSSNISVEKIQKIVSDFYNISQKQIIEKGRSKNVAIPRMICMYLCRELTNQTLSDIGLKFGNRDHSTVHNACERISKMIESDTDTKNKINQITHLIEIN